MGCSRTVKSSSLVILNQHGLTLLCIDRHLIFTLVSMLGCICRHSITNSRMKTWYAITVASAYRTIKRLSIEKIVLVMSAVCIEHNCGESKPPCGKPVSGLFWMGNDLPTYCSEFLCDIFGCSYVSVSHAVLCQMPWPRLFWTVFLLWILFIFLFRKP